MTKGTLVPAVKLLEISGGRPRLDRYELVAELAAGGMATVFLGRMAGVGGFQRFVAIKRLHPHLAHEEEFVEMFLDEARLAAGIHHPNVVPILEVGTSDRGYYLVMEYIEGDTLARLLARAATIGERIPIPIVIRIVLDTLAGLHAAHELTDDEGKLLDLVHRDVSPQNILVGIDGSSRITDFGVARAEARLSWTRAGQLKGKLAYMAPEQAKGGKVDRRADLFAVGTILWEVLAGKRLFKGEAEADTLNRVLFEPIPELRDNAVDVPPGIESIVMRALNRNPEERPATAADFADALERAARLAEAIASPREVASYVQKVLGQEISQQRDAVRTWLAQSEPSRTQLGEHDDHARIEPSPLPKAKNMSSVSAAALSLPPHLAELGADLAETPEGVDLSIDFDAPKARRGVFLGGVAALACAGILLALFWPASRGGGPTPATSMPQGTGASTSPGAFSRLGEPAHREAVPAAPPSAQASASAQPVLAASAQVPRAANAPGFAAPFASGRRIRPVAAPANATDDVPRNPYR